MAKNKTRARFWFNVLFPLACGFVFAYPVARLTSWYFGDTGFSLLVGVALWVAGYLAMYYSFRGPNMKVRYFVVHWMGFGFVFAVLVLAAEGVRWLIPVQDRFLAQLVIIAGLLLVLFAIGLSHHLSVRQHEVRTSKVTRPWRVAQISDVHIGSRRSGYMERIVNRINDLEPDYVVITGDLVDSSSVEFESLQSIGAIRARTFFSIGNHERYADLEKILDIARRLG